MKKLDQESVEDPQGVFREHPSMKYLGFALILGWHYSLWFVPRTFVNTPLLAQTITFSWLICLGSSVIALFLIPAALGRKKVLSRFRWLFWAAPIVTCLGSLGITLLPLAVTVPSVSFALAALLGVTGAILWILWGEHYACIKANFSMSHIGPVFGLVLLGSLMIASFLPVVLSALFVAALPIVSGFFLLSESAHDKTRPLPPLLPKSANKEGLKSIGIVSFISFIAAAACYFLVAIIPWEVLPTADLSFTFGVVGGAFLMLAIAAVCIVSKNKINIFKMMPWLLVFVVIAFALFLADSMFFFAAFIMALAVSSIFEVLLVIYFGILTSKGYVAPAIAFGFSGGCIRGGIALGNALAIVYEHNPSFAAAFTPETALAFIAVIVVLIIPLVRQEYSIATLTSAPPEASSLDKICQEIAGEFKLSGRETEILTLLSHGYSTDGIAKKLVISPYTVNTHIRHTYDKMQIHKRSELLNYINMQRSDY
ncbi:MAG: LuxR C-terminal-related transcriptional regulator [Raoultibacter sp.]